jgi:hypothetical protein
MNKYDEANKNVMKITRLLFEDVCNDQHIVITANRVDGGREKMGVSFQFSGFDEYAEPIPDRKRIMADVVKLLNRLYFSGNYTVAYLHNTKLHISTLAQIK